MKNYPAVFLDLVKSANDDRFASTLKNDPSAISCYSVRLGLGHNPILGRALGLLVLLYGVAITGCAHWSRPSWSTADATEELQSANLPYGNTTKSPIAPDLVSVETVLIRFSESQLDQLNQSWLAADESILELEQRRLLDMNGVRVGVIRGDLPEPIQRQLESSRAQQRTDVVEQMGLGADSDSRIKQLNCRAGRRKDLIIRRELNQPLSVVTTIDGSVSGHLFERASAVLSLTMYPQANGTAVAELIPEVQHGEPRKSFVSGEFGMRQELKRDTKHWKPLKIRTLLATNDVLMISSTLPSKALGHAFFTTETPQQTEEKIVLLVRLASTQLDDLFALDAADQAKAVMEK